MIFIFLFCANSHLFCTNKQHRQNTKKNERKYLKSTIKYISIADLILLFVNASNTISFKETLSAENKTITLKDGYTRQLLKICYVLQIKHFIGN